jgi:hypothetical protein
VHMKYLTLDVLKELFPEVDATDHLLQAALDLIQVAQPEHLVHTLVGTPAQVEEH